MFYVVEFHDGFYQGINWGPLNDQQAKLMLERKRLAYRIECDRATSSGYRISYNKSYVMDTEEQFSKRKVAWS